MIALTGCGSNLATDCGLSGLLQLARAASVAPAAGASAKLSPLSHQVRFHLCAAACSCLHFRPSVPPPFLPVLPLGGEHGISRPAAEPAHSLIHCRTMDQTSALLQFQLFPTSFPSLNCWRTPLALNHWTSSPLACGWQSPLDGLMDEWKCERRHTQSCHVLEKL